MMYMFSEGSKMSHSSNRRCRKLRSEELTRRSPRLHNLHSNVLKCEIVERNKMKCQKIQRNSCPVLTHSKRRFVKCESIDVGKTTTENNSDSDENVVKILTYSSSDSNASCKKVKRFKTSNNCSSDQNEPVEKKKIINEPKSGYNLRSAKVIENLGHSSNSVVTKDKHSYNLRRKGPRFKKNDCTAPNSVVVKSELIKKRRYNLRKSSQVIGSDCECNAVLKNVTNDKQNNNFRRKSPRFTKNNSEAWNNLIVQSSESDIVKVEKEMTKKPCKMSLKENKTERTKTSPSADTPDSKIITTQKHSVTMPFSLSQDRKKDDKKPKVRKKGTLAQKRELRAMLEKQDEGYEDDAFEGMPFRNRKPLIKCNLSPVILDTSIQFDTIKNIKTPCNKTPVNRLRPAGPLSSGTSESDTMTPGLLNAVNRNYIDCYVNRLKKRKIRLGGGNTKIKCRTPLSKKPCRIIESKAFSFDSSFNLQKSATENENSEDDDYYWTDMEL